MTMGLPCDREGYDLRMPQCPKCGSRGCPSLHRYRGECSADKSTSEPVAPVKAVGSEVMRECDWPANTPFKFLDEPGEHEPCYVVMPGGAMLPLNHHVGEGVDIARAKFIVAACNAALVSADSNDEFYELGKRDGYEDAIQDLDIATGGDGEFKGSTIPGETVDVPTMKARIISRAVPARATSAHHARAIAEILDPVAFDPISLRNDQHPTWMCRRETAIETANKILSLAPVKAVGSEALREARIAELEAALEDLTHSAERRIESGFWPMDFHYVTRRARAVLTTKAPQAWLEAKAEIDANWPDPTPDRKAQT